MKTFEKVNTDDFVMTEGTPVLVQPESFMFDPYYNPLGKGSLSLNMVIGPDDVSVAQQKAENFNPVFDDEVTLMVHGVAKRISGDKAPVDKTNVQLGNPVNNPPYNNWSVNQPSVPHDSGDKGTQDLGLRNLIIDGVNGYDLVQTSLH